MQVPSDRWTGRAWNGKRQQFHLLAEMLGVVNPFISPGELQDLYRKVASPKLFAESIRPFLETSGMTEEEATERLVDIERKLGLTQPIHFRSLKEGTVDPRTFNGVAIWPAGTVNWTRLRLEQILTAMQAGATFKAIIVCGTSRVCNGPADRKHPLIRNISEGEEPTELDLQRQLAESGLCDPNLFKFPSFPETKPGERVLSLEQMLRHLIESGQYDELIGGADLYVPSTPNSLYVPLHASRILGHDNVWFSQAGANLVSQTPNSWWPTDQAILTLPQGIIRLWVELLEWECMTPERKGRRKR